MNSKLDRMVRGATPRVNIDPLHQELHKVEKQQLQNYKDGLVKKVTAVCGKKWAPTIPMTSRMRELPQCSNCFPNVEYSLAN